MDILLSKFEKQHTINLKSLAEKMKKRTRGKFQDVKVRDCVAVFVSEFDRGKGDPRNIIGVVTEVNNDMYRIGTRGGIIYKYLLRTCFECVKYKGLTVDSDPKSTALDK